MVSGVLHSWKPCDGPSPSPSPGPVPVPLPRPKREGQESRPGLHTTTTRYSHSCSFSLLLSLILLFYPSFKLLFPSADPTEFRYCKKDRRSIHPTRESPKGNWATTNFLFSESREAFPQRQASHRDTEQDRSAPTFGASSQNHFPPPLTPSPTSTPPPPPPPSQRFQVLVDE